MGLKLYVFNHTLCGYYTGYALGIVAENKAQAEDVYGDQTHNKHYSVKEYDIKSKMLIVPVGFEDEQIKAEYV